MTGQTITGGGARVVTGEPGCGRTTFLDAAARSFPAGTVVRVAAGPGASAVPLSGLRALLRLLGAPPGDRPGGNPAAREAPVEGAPGAVLLGALRAASAEAPLLVCADDAHLWDASTRAAVGHAAGLLRGDGPVRLLLSVAGHRRVDAEFAGLPVIRLDPLPPTEAAALVEEAAGGAVDRAVRDDLVDAADGHPALLLAMVRRLSTAQLRGRRTPPPPPDDAELLGGLAGGLLTPCSPAQEDLLLIVAAALCDGDADDARAARVDLSVALRAAARLHATRPHARRAASPTSPPEAPAGPETSAPHDVPALAEAPALPEALSLAGGEVGFHSALLRRAVYAAARPERRRAAHRALAGALPDAGSAGLPALLHRARGTPAPRPATAAELARAADDAVHGASHRLRCAAFARAAELAEDPVRRAEWSTAAAEAALLGGRTRRALRLLDPARLDRARLDPVPTDSGLCGSGPDDAAAERVRGRAELVRGMTLLCDGPVDEARASLLLAARLLAAAAPAQAQSALLAASDAAWAAGDAAGCLRALGEGEEAGVREGPLAPRSPASPPVGPPPARAPAPRPPAPPRPPESGSPLPAYRAGLRALLEGRFAEAEGPLRRLVAEAERAQTADEPEAALRATAAALLLGDLGGARRTGARALAVARTTGHAMALARAREYLAYAELRSGRHALARTHAEEGLRTALRTGQGNKAAHYRAVLALAASIEAGPDQVADHAQAALATARRHGLAQAATMAEWATARADLARGRPRDAAARLAPLVCAGTRRGHFAVWMPAVPCFVEAVAATAARTPAHRPDTREHRSETAAHDAATARHGAAAHDGVAAPDGTAACDAVAETASTVLACGKAAVTGGSPAVRPATAARHDPAARHGTAARPGAAARHGAAGATGPAAAGGTAWTAAVAVVEEFARWAGLGADPQAPAQLLRCRALLAPADRADALYRAALDLHDAAGGGDFERARTELLHGKWLRRRRRLREARERLGAALVGFERCGARAWADQARAELRAGGAAPAGATGAGGLSALTPQQLRIVRCVADGATNREVALALSVSTRTVDYHLRKVFAALGVRSRVELARLVDRAR